MLYISPKQVWYSCTQQYAKLLSLAFEVVVLKMFISFGSNTLNIYIVRVFRQKKVRHCIIKIRCESSRSPTLACAYILISLLCLELQSM